MSASTSAVLNGPDFEQPLNDGTQEAMDAVAQLLLRPGVPSSVVGTWTLALIEDARKRIYAVGTERGYEPDACSPRSVRES